MNVLERKILQRLIESIFMNNLDGRSQCQTQACCICHAVVDVMCCFAKITRRQCIRTLCIDLGMAALRLQTHSAESRDCPDRESI